MTNTYLLKSSEMKCILYYIYGHLLAKQNRIIDGTLFLASKNMFLIL